MKSVSPHTATIFLTLATILVAAPLFVGCGSPQAARAADEAAPDAAPDAAAAKVDGEQLFTLKILPLLKSKCFACHGEKPDDLKGEFDIRSRAGLLKGGESGDAAIVPHKAGDSPLFEAVQWNGLEMPPKENDRLTAAQIELVRKWIDAGAPWPDEATQRKHREAQWALPSTDEGVLMKTSGGLSDDWTYRRYEPADIWAFEPVEKPNVPKSAQPRTNPIDAFIDVNLTDAGLKPAGRADPRTLIRRATFDLLGLPPTPEEVERFTAAWQRDADTAYRELIERLLASPHYGERWAQHWLDVVRYADSSGFSNDYERSNAWRYRDYVIRSFNADKPYDQFVVEQLAGDESKPDDPEMLIAVGFLRMGPWEHTPMSPTVVSRQAFLDDVVNIVGQTFLSTTMRCCKCHDHKFDPLPTRDYYRMYAAFSATQPAEREAAFLPSENRAAFDEDRRHVKALLDYAQAEADKLEAKREDAAKKWYAERNMKYVPYGERLRLPTDDKPPRHIGLDTTDEGQLKVREQDVRIWTRAAERFEPLAQSVYNGGDLFQLSVKLRMPNPNNKGEMARSKTVPKDHILSGGSIYGRAAEVDPGVLSAVSLSANSNRPSDKKLGDKKLGDKKLGDKKLGDKNPNDKDAWTLSNDMNGRRLGLARWIADPRNPLTTRSIVNRVWGWHFGRAIAASPNNFGHTGHKPTHPQLLDWLAATFVEDGWSIKQLHRRIMTSEAYMRAAEPVDADAVAEKDPNNLLLASFSPRRLAAEELRDAMLAVTGELNDELGGLPIRPEINFEVAMAPRMIQFSIAPAYQPSRTPAERNRRSIYALQVRGLADPLMEVFNKPNSNDSCEARDASNVTPQAFAMLNGDSVTNRSIALALRLEREAKTPDHDPDHGIDARIARAFQLAFGRDPQADEAALLAKHYEKMLAYHRDRKPEPVRFPTRITRSLVEEFSGAPFEYEERLDMYEDYTPDKQAADVSAETRALADIALLIFNANEFAYVY